MPPCGNCQEWVRIRLPQNTWFLWLSRMMPTLGLNPSRSSIINLNSFVESIIALALRESKHRVSRTLAPDRKWRPAAYESQPVLRFDAEGSPCGCRGRQSPTDAARRFHQATVRRHLQLHADGPSSHSQGRRDRARRDESRGRHRTADAGCSAGGAVAGKRSLSEIRP